MVVLMFWLGWDFALIAVAVAPFLLFFVSRIRRAVKTATHEVRRRQADIVATVSQGLESMRVVEALDRHDFEEQKLAQISAHTVAAALGARRVKQLVSPIVAVVVAFCTAFVLWRGSSLIPSGAMTAGTLTVYIACLTNFFKPVQDLAKMTNTIATSVAIDRVSDLLNNTTIPERPNAAEPESLRGEITLDRVGFDYGAGTPVLRDLSFTVSPGQMVGIVGPTGSGKSTIVSLVPRFYDVTSGSVTIDGIDVRDYKLHAIRNQIGFVLQDTVLFGGTVRDNIAFGRPDTTDDEIVAAAKLANAHEFIRAMPEGYDSLVGERGLTLSGGQRQRIGIARALIRDDPMLILDEPTAALDAASEQSVMEALQRLMTDRTVMVIAHRLSTIREADNIVVLKDGVIAEQGTHHALMASDGVYAALHHIQSDGGAD
jgi:ABC-type multidrug transport system fused ATPase/permease subunit